MSKKGTLAKKLSEPKQVGLYKNYTVLGEHVLSFSEIVNAYKGQKMYANELANLFLLRNAEALQFLEIEVGSTTGIGVCLITSRYIGCVPLISPTTGLPGGFLNVNGRFGEDISELLSVIDGTIEPEYNDKLKFYQDILVKPPLFFECMKYIDKYIEAKKYKWRKFDNVEKIQSRPTSSTQWDKYALKSYDPANTFRYNNRCNILKREHPEWQELNYVLDFCIKEVMSSRTPIRSRTAYLAKINSLSNSYDRRSLPVVKEVKIHRFDPAIIESLKIAANRVLQSVSSINCAWRMDFAEFFERYVQYIMNKIASTKGARFSANPKFSVNGSRPTWALKYIEPDIIIDKNDMQYIIDAKYKAHMFNIYNDAEQLKETFREDLHQVLAYSSFDSKIHKHVMLVYPSNKEVIIRKMNISSSLNRCSSSVYLVGIPLKKSVHDETIDELTKLITFNSTD